jgi:succinate dehydrogenase / fumarate reductase cytochrome b subunit
LAGSKNSLIVFFASPIGRKLLTGITGLALTVFVLEHMLGNLVFFSSDPNAYNLYADFLMGWGTILYVIEIALLALLVVHVVLGVSIYIRKRQARPIDYARYESAGFPSRQTTSSRTMIITGIVLGAFLVFHLLSFKFGPGVAEGYVVTVDGEPIRDLRRLMVEKFQNPLYAFGYPAIMALLGFHLRHGVWSALQSLGLLNARWSPLVYSFGGFLAVLLAVGFIVLPLWIFFEGGAA